MKKLLFCHKFPKILTCPGAFFALLVILYIITGTPSASGADTDGASDNGGNIINAGESDAIRAGGIVYEIQPGQSVLLNPDDFRRFYQRSFQDSPCFVVLTATSPMESGVLSAGERKLTTSLLEQFSFYFDDSNAGKFPLDSLIFRADDDFYRPMVFTFRIYGERQNAYASGNLTIRAAGTGDNIDNITDSPDNAHTPEVPPPPSESTATPTPTVTPSATPTPSPTPVPAATPTPTDTITPRPTVIPRDTATPRPTITPRNTVTPRPTQTSDPSDLDRVGMIRYYITYSDSAQLNANDFARFFRRRFPGYDPRSVKFHAAPDSGRLYYNYYGAASFGSSSRKQITNANCENLEFFLNPDNQSQYALSELTFLPSGGLNACVTIPFTAFGVDSGQQARGNVFISATRVIIADVYGATPVNTAVPFPASHIASAVEIATGATPAAFKLLESPDFKTGSVCYGKQQIPASVSQIYTWPEGSQPFENLTFLPAADFTGSVEIPYAALDENGKFIGAGGFNLGIVNQIKRFSDVNSSTWCYKYITELADAGIVDGYSDGSFRFNNSVSYGAALKLILLSAGYPEQPPLQSGGLFSGYFQKAVDEKIITNPEKIKLTEPITRLQMAEIAAGAMKLNLSGLSGVQSFTDTDSDSVRVLHAAGIVNGYFENGVSLYRPDGTLTRGQLAAIVWRMRARTD